MGIFPGVLETLLVFKRRLEDLPSLALAEEGDTGNCDTLMEPSATVELESYRQQVKFIGKHGMVLCLEKVKYNPIDKISI